MQRRKRSDLLLGEVGKSFTTGRPRKDLFTRGYGEVVLSRELEKGWDLNIVGKFWLIDII